MRRTPLVIAAVLTAVTAATPAVAHPDWWDQRDRPGDFRCDAYWDRGRTDCDAAWRTRGLASERGVQPYGHYGPHHPVPRPRHAPPVHRDPARMDWCAWRFRSYDPRTGYYLTYSGHYRFCG